MLIATRVPKEMDKAVIFKSSVPSCIYVLKNGKACNFINFRFMTKLDTEIEELTAEVNMGHPTIYIDSKEATADVMEPIAALRARHFAEFQAELERANNKNQDAGTTQVQKLNVANSSTIAEGASGSDSTNAAPAAVGANVNVAKSLLAKPGAAK